MSEGFDVQEIQRLLPHRHPFLLVDRVLEIDPGVSIRAIKNITVDEPFFQGHFPGIPIFPGVLILEVMAQASGLLVFKTPEYCPEDDNLYMFRRGRQGPLQEAGRARRPAGGQCETAVDTPELRLVRCHRLGRVAKSWPPPGSCACSRNCRQRRKPDLDT